jgi:hypothetical protein
MQASGYKGLMAAVVRAALDGLFHVQEADTAMQWINGPECESYCLALGVDYRGIRELAAARYQTILAKYDKCHV